MSARSSLRIALALLFVAAVVAFFALGGPRYLSLDTIKANRDALLRFTQDHYATLTNMMPTSGANRSYGNMLPTT